MLTRERPDGGRAPGIGPYLMHSATVVAIVVIWFILALLTSVGMRSAGQDDRGSAMSIDRVPFSDRGVELATATVEPDEPISACGQLEHTVWYGLDLGADVALSVRAVPDIDAADDLAIAAWRVGPDERLVEIGCADERAAGAPEQLVFAASAGQPSYVQVGTRPTPASTPGSFTLLVDAQHPDNDLFAFARAVSEDGAPWVDADVDSIDARREPGEPTASCAELVATTWYTLTAPEDAVLAASVAPSLTETSVMDFAVAVYQGDSLASLKEVACADEAGVQEPERVEVPIVAGEPYAIQVGTVLGEEAWPGFFSLQIAGRQAIELEAVPALRFGADPVALSAAAVSGLPVDFETDGPCRILEGSLITDGAGTCTIVARQPGDADWAPAPEVRRTIDIARASQAIELEAVPALRFGADPVALSAAAVSGLPVDFETDGPCRILEGSLITDGAGTCTIVARQPGDADWAPAPEVRRTIDIARASQAIELEAVPALRFGADPVALSAAAVSGLPVDFETDGPCRILEGSLITDGAGTCTIVARQPGDADWAPAPEVRRTIDIARASQAIELQPLDGVVVGEPVEVALADSGLPVTLETRGACLPDGASLRPIGSGTCSITVTQPGDDDWEPAEPVTLTTRIGRGGQTVRLEDVPDTVFGAEPLPITALSSSGLPVRLDAEGPCRVENGSLIADGAGICTVVAQQPGDIDWRPAVTMRKTFRIDRAPQAIEFPAIEPRSIEEGTIVLGGSATSELPVTYVARGACEVDGDTLAITDTGECSITAYQPGNADWAAAPGVARQITIDPDGAIRARE